MKHTYLNYLEKMERDPKLNELGTFFSSVLENAFDTKVNGNLPRWLEAYSNLPEIIPTEVNIDINTPFAKGNIEDKTTEFLTDQLHILHPWRKGPFELFDIFIDTEWRSDWKWNRLSPHIASWKNKNVFDIGCGNGYHCFRIAAQGAATVTGIDTSLLSIMQFKTLQKYFKIDNVEIFPVGIQNVPELGALFDTVLSMGVLYHRKEPMEHLEKIHDLLVPGGECVVETLIIDGETQDCLEPDSRYAMMKNVFKIPSVKLLEKWLAESGFSDIRTLDVTTTTVEEQRSTGYMKFHSLKNFLNPQDPSQTVEGYPAPKRAMVLAQKD